MSVLNSNIVSSTTTRVEQICEIINPVVKSAIESLRSYIYDKYVEFAVTYTYKLNTWDQSISLLTILGANEGENELQQRIVKNYIAVTEKLGEVTNVRITLTTIH